MIVNRNYIERSGGAKLLVEYCENIADELDIDLTKEPYWVLATIKDMHLADYCKLIIQTKTKSAMISFSHEEIEKYSTSVDCDNIENKIRNKFETLK